MENNPGNLKSSMFGGFKKKDVLSYIFEINESSQEAQQKFTEQLDEVSRSRDELRYTVTELESRLHGLQAEMDEAARSLNLEQAKRLEAEEMLEKLRHDAQKLEIASKEKEGELNEATAQLLELRSKKRELQEEREQVELAASQIAGLLSEARADADRMVDDARAESGSIIEAANSVADEIKEAARAAAAKYIDEANSGAVGLLGKFSAFEEELERLKECLAEIDSVALLAKERIPEKLVHEFAAKDPENAENGTGSKQDEAAEQKANNFTREVLNRYGVRKDDSGFFRLAAERT